jgi:hypothetical protein
MPDERPRADLSPEPKTSVLSSGRCGYNSPRIIEFLNALAHRSGDQSGLKGLSFRPPRHGWVLDVLGGGLTGPTADDVGRTWGREPGGERRLSTTLPADHARGLSSGLIHLRSERCAEDHLATLSLVMDVAHHRYASGRETK